MITRVDCIIGVDFYMHFFNRFLAVSFSIVIMSELDLTCDSICFQDGQNSNKHKVNQKQIQKFRLYIRKLILSKIADSKEGSTALRKKIIIDLQMCLYMELGGLNFQSMCKLNNELIFQQEIFKSLHKEEQQEKKINLSHAKRPSLFTKQELNFFMKNVGEIIEPIIIDYFQCQDIDLNNRIIKCLANMLAFEIAKTVTRICLNK